MHRRAARRLLASWPGPPPITALCQALGHLIPCVRERAACVLGEIGTDDPAVIAALGECLRDGHTRVRYHAAYALGRIGALAAVAPLTDALRDPDADVRYQAAVGLGLLGDPTAADALIRLLQDEKTHVRHSAARALGLIGADRAQAALSAAATLDPSPRVRLEAAAALNRLCT
ncbi:MAG: HEAT repeat domain-containing protein [Chloroflexota bacterium]